MKIIQVHNYYQQAGGEDAVVKAEAELLRTHGHEVVTYYKNNRSLVGRWQLVVGSFKTLWNWEIYCEFRKLLQKEKPDVVHCHNIFPLISPSIYWACAKKKVPVVQTLHNYRLLCLNAFLFRQSRHQDDKLQTPDSKLKTGPSGAVCELCVKKSFKWPGIRYGCYRGSKAGSLVVALMLFIHQRLGTWSKKVTAYIALTEFQKLKMIEGGLPVDKIRVKPNFIQQDDLATKERIEHDTGGLFSDPSVSSVVNTPYCLFVGRLSPEKGCDVLIRAWAQFQEKLTAHGSKPPASDHQPQLIIVGDGPERDALEELAKSLQLSAVSFMGKQPKAGVLKLMKEASFLVLPSVWYEGFPMTIVEAFSCEIAVIAPNDGGMKNIIVEQQNGLKFGLGNAGQLAGKIEWAFRHPSEMKDMGRAAHREFEEKYSAEANYNLLINIYEQVI